jgi:hypothetical protein
MTKFVVLWRRNTLAPWPTDRLEIAENMEAMFDSIERYMGAGMVRENSFFMDGDSGSFIFEGTSEDVLKMTSFFTPLLQYDVKEMVLTRWGRIRCWRAYECKS